jgi:hypothetical protein
MQAYLSPKNGELRIERTNFAPTVSVQTTSGTDSFIRFDTFYPTY